MATTVEIIAEAMIGTTEMTTIGTTATTTIDTIATTTIDIATATTDTVTTVIRGIHGETHLTAFTRTAVGMTRSAPITSPTRVDAMTIATTTIATIATIETEIGRARAATSAVGTRTESAKR